MLASEISRLSGKELIPVQSEYLHSGYKEDNVILEEVIYNNELYEGKFKVTDAYLPTDGKFHLSMTTVGNCISQFGIICACMKHGLREKPGEVYAMKYNISFKKTVSEKEFSIVGNLEKKRKLSTGVVYRGYGEVGDGAFKFETIFFFPFVE